MNDNLSWIDISHLIRYLVTGIVTFIQNGYVQLLFEILDVILSDNLFSFIKIKAFSFHYKTDEYCSFHLIKTFCQYCSSNFFFTSQYHLKILAGSVDLSIIINFNNFCIRWDFSESCFFYFRGHLL